MPRLRFAQFSKRVSPSYINDAEGWDRLQAMHFADEHGLKYVQVTEGEDEIKFRQKDAGVGELERIPDESVPGFYLLVEKDEEAGK